MKLNLSGQKSTKKSISRTDQGVIIHFTQSIKQSQNYQSAEVSIGISIPVGDSDKEVRRGFRRAERLIEEPLVAKFNQQKDLLGKLKS